MGADLRVTAPPGVARRIAVENVRRTRIICLLMLLISGVSLAIFATLEPVDVVEAAWRVRLLAGHASLVVLVTVLLVVTTRPRWRGGELPEVALWKIRSLEWVGLTGLLGAGIYFTAVDQAVTDAITPFLLVCVLAGLLVLMPVTHSVVAFGVAALLFGLVMQVLAAGATAGDGTAAVSQAMVASHQINGLAAAVLGLLLSIVRYNGAVYLLVQQDEIEQQRAALERANTALAHTAAHDELTGLVNRRAANERIGTEVERLRRSGGSLSLLLLDLDEFKLVNDSLGHPTGDLVLQRVAAILRSRLRQVDLVARWGGEEFLVLLVETDLAGAAAVAEELRRSVAAEPLDLGGAGRAPMTVSIGVTQVDAALPAPNEHAYRTVDEALYAAKAAGRDRVMLASTASTAPTAPTAPSASPVGTEPAAPTRPVVPRRAGSGG